MTVNFVTIIRRRGRDQTGQVAWVPAWWGWDRATMEAAEREEYYPDEEPDPDEPDWDQLEAQFYGV